MNATITGSWLAWVALGAGKARTWFRSGDVLEVKVDLCPWPGSDEAWVGCLEDLVTEWTTEVTMFGTWEEVREVLFLRWVHHLTNGRGR